MIRQKSLFFFKHYIRFLLFFNENKQIKNIDKKNYDMYHLRTQN